MKITRFVLPTAALGMAAAMLLPVEESRAYSLLGFSLGLGQRDFRVFNNFTDPTANNNNSADPNFPGYQGAVMAIWKASVEWQSSLHGNGNGDPHQPFGLGSGGANFDPTFQGIANTTGSTTENIHSEITGCDGGVLAFTESPWSDGWRIRYYACWTWEDGPGITMPTSNWDLQGIACHEYGHALGLGHSADLSATMYASANGPSVGTRSIAPDDSNGVKAIYGTASASKPKILGVCVQGGQITIEGLNFSATGNVVWFTQAASGGTGQPIQVTNVTSNGTTIQVSIPGTAGPGDVLVRNNGGAHANLSNAWPTNLQDTPGGCGGGPSCTPPTNYCVAAPNSTGSGMVMSSTGTTCVSDGFFRLEAYGGPAGRPGIFYYGENQIQVPFGNGFRCVGGGVAGIYRLPVVFIDSFGDVFFNVDWTAPPFGSGNGAWAPGTTWNVQFWYRDPPAGGSNFNLTDGLHVEIGP